MTTTNMNAKEASMEAYWKNDFAPLQAAGKVILRELREDEAGGDLHRRILSAGSHLYFPSSSNNSGFAHEQSIPLPPHLQNEVNTVQYSLLMGLLPEANLAWMSVDDRLFLWSLEDQENFLDLKMASSQCIVSVGIAPPKKGVFTKAVEWCLVVSTPDEVMLCAVARQNDRLHLVPTRYTVPTDSIPIVSICGLPNSGRIFMGGHDGSLYEFSYENLVAKAAPPALKTMDQREADYYDGTASSVKLQSQLPSVAFKVVTGGKRAFSALLGGGGNGRATKCRKLNHSATGFSAAASTVVPDWLLKAPAAIFGAGTTSSLQKIVHDPERQCLYTLTARGCVGVYDLRSRELVLKASIDCDKIARLYLSAVAKGHMYAPSSNIEFAGGGSAAQAGVGGMDGARSILKLAESNGAKAKILAPVSLHVIPRTGSSRLTLLAVTAGGLRYYLTSLSPSSLSKSNLVPSSKILMCHMRSPPPVDPTTGQIKESFDEGNVPGGMVPRLLPQTIVDASSYSDGHLFLALQRPPLQAANGGTTKEVGNIIVGTNADFVARKVTKKDSKTIRELSGGVSETISLPTSLLPGGRIIDASTLGSVRKSPLMKLMMNSQTPSDSELGVGMVPAYYPKIVGKEANKKKEDKNKQQLATSSSDAARSSTALVTTNKASNSSESAIVMRALWNFLLSRPLGHGIAFQSTLPASTYGAGASEPQVYRISNRYGSAGFSSTAGSTKNNSSMARARSSNTSTSVRLSPWLLRPAMVPLNEMAINHILSSTRTVAVSVGGLHYFSSSTILSTLAKTLEVSGHDVAQDLGVVEFFSNYGHKESCTLCLMLAIGSGPVKGNGAEDLKSRALNAAFGRGGAPRLDRKAAMEDGSDPYVVSEVASDPLVPAGYDFVPSFLSEGVLSLASRLLRPIWYKPAVVVTEGQTIKIAGSISKRLPAKVELLLDDKTMEEVRSPLFALKQAIQQCFRPAIENVPGVRKPDSNQMDIDETNVLTGYMRFQGSMTLLGTATGVLSKEEAISTARLIEERNLHSLFRLVSRSVQLLDLLSLLKRAQHMFDLPEVEWGLLHGLTVSQLVESRDCQERIENLLNALVSNTKAVNGTTVTPTADSDQLAKSLATQCYLFFSPGSRFSYLGFRSANEALGCMELSARRATLGKQAVEHFRMAASFWTSAQLITGSLMHTGEAETYEQKVNIALQFSSPLARASSVLLQIGEVVAIVDICTITASNFAGKTGIKMLTNGEQLGLPWERTLYHDRNADEVTPQGSSGMVSTASSSSAIVVAASVTGQDAISTCHAIMLYHLLSLLKSSVPEETKRMMVSACAASSDKQFLKALFDCLLKTGNESTLMKIDSIDLEKWIEEKEDPQLMWQYYMIQRNHTKAGEIMMKSAMDKNPILSLDERVLFLERSQSAYNSALLAAQNQVNQIDADPQELERKRVLASEYLDVARLQQQTLKKITSLGLEDQFDEEKLQTLKMTLVAVNDLYMDYAAAVHLFDLCLRILHSCRHTDGNLIELLWKSVICQEILPCATQSETTFNFLKSLMGGSLINDSIVLLSQASQEGDDLPLFESGTWLKPLKQTVESLGSELFGTGADYVCPVELLVTSLEGSRHALQANPSVPWPLQALLSIGVSFPDLLDAYEGVLDGEVRSLMGGANPLRRYLSLKSIVELLEEWVSVSSNGGNQNRAYRELSNAVISNRLMSQIDDFKASLRELGNNGGGDEVQSVLGRLHRAEEAIGRIS